MCLLGPIQTDVSGVSTNDLSSGSLIITSVGMTALYAASPVGSALSGRPTTTLLVKLFTPSAPTIISPDITSPDASLTETHGLGVGSMKTTFDLSRIVKLGEPEIRSNNIEWRSARWI